MGNSQQRVRPARVFISCGQRSPEEKGLGSSCKAHFERRGFFVYLAEEVQSLEALTENIFRHLKNSEYAVFIDCAREELTPGKFRGSVFVNQELAIAAFLQIESRVFHQEGVAREGVADYLIAKPVRFNSRQQFLGKLRRQTKEWHPDWRNELSVSFLRKVNNVRMSDGRYADWYHLHVANNHESKRALNCAVYISEIRKLDSGVGLQPNAPKPGPSELVWSGTDLFERHIMPRSGGEVDAFFIMRGEDFIRFHHRPHTSSMYGLPTIHKGIYLLTYLVVSDSFEPVTNNFRLEFGGDYTQIRFSEWSGDTS